MPVLLYRVRSDLEISRDCGELETTAFHLTHIAQGLEVFYVSNKATIVVPKTLKNSSKWMRSSVLFENSPLRRHPMCRKTTKREGGRRRQFHLMGAELRSQYRAQLKGGPQVA